MPIGFESLNSLVLTLFEMLLNVSVVHSEVRQTGVSWSSQTRSVAPTALLHCSNLTDRWPAICKSGQASQTASMDQPIHYRYRV